MAKKKDGFFRRKKEKTEISAESNNNVNKAGDNPSDDAIPTEQDVKNDHPASEQLSESNEDRIPDILLQDQPQSVSANDAEVQGQSETEKDVSEQSKENAPKDTQAEPFSFRFDENGIAFDDDPQKDQSEDNKSSTTKKPNRRKKTIIGIVVVFVVLIALIAAVSAIVSSFSSSIKEVKTSPLKRGSVENLVNADGNVISTSTAAVSNSSGMRITEVHVSVGDYVSEGDALCELQADSSSQSASMSAAYGDATVAATPTSDTVTANADGVITSVKAEVGGAASGDLFSIQNTDSLMIEVSVSETDINKVGIGMPVRITSEGTANRQYSGTVAAIAPTSSDTASVNSGNASAGYSGLTGAATGSSTPTYKVNVSLNLPIDGLRIGMKTNQDIIIDSHKDVFVVSYDALVKNGDNSYQIYVAEDVDGIKTVKAIPVTVGLQGDVSVEIISDQLKENLEVIQETDKVSEGDKVIISDKSTTSSDGK